MKFRVYNHNAPADHKLQNVVIDTESNPQAFARMVLTATGNGMNAEFTAKAMTTDAALRALPLGEHLRIKTNWLDFELHEHRIDITLTHVDA